MKYLFALSLIFPVSSLAALTNKAANAPTEAAGVDKKCLNCSLESSLPIKRNLEYNNLMPDSPAGLNLPEPKSGQQ